MGKSTSSRETSAPSAPAAGFLTLYPLGASDTAVAYFYKRPDGSVFTLGSLETAQTWSALQTFSAGLTSTAGTTTLGTVNASGVLTSTVAGQVLTNVSGGTGVTYMRLGNTGGDFIFGMDANGGGALGPTLSGYQTILRSAARIVLSADQGVTAHVTVGTTGAVTIPGTLASGALTVTGTGTFSSTIKSGGYTVATLPANSAGTFAYVTDQLTAVNAKGAAPTGGGAVVCYQMNTGAGWVGI